MNAALLLVHCLTLVPFPLQYIHDYSEVDPGSHYQGLEMLTLVVWCLQITLHTLESDGHDCSFLSSSEKSKRPSLQRQFTIDAFTHSVMESITGGVSATKDTGSSTPEIVKSKELLSPFPEGAKSSKAKGQFTPTPFMYSFTHECYFDLQLNLTMTLCLVFVWLVRNPPMSTQRK